MDNRYVKITSGGSEATIDRLGGRLVSFKINGVEVMATNAAWSAISKNMFPAPGPIAQKGVPTEEEVYVINGTEKKHQIIKHNGGRYHMGQHGFAQDKEFKINTATKNGVMMYIEADDFSYNEYPYDFRYWVGMELSATGQLEYMSYAQNNDNKDMLAGMGWHPAFKLHRNPERYKVIITNLKCNDKCTLKEGEQIPATAIINSKDALKFEGIESADVTIVYTDDYGEEVTYLSMHTEEPYLWLWSKAPEKEGQDNFICIEPVNTQTRQISKLTTQDKTAELAHDGAVIVKKRDEFDAPRTAEKVAEEIENQTLRVTTSVNSRYINKITKATRAQKR